MKIENGKKTKKKGNQIEDWLPSNERQMSVPQSKRYVYFHMVYFPKELQFS